LIIRDIYYRNGDKLVTTLVRPVRSASLSGYVDLAQSLGLDAQRMLRRVGIGVRALDDPETPIPAEAVRALLEDSAHAAGVEDFALRLASRRTLSNLGPISLILKEEPTPRQALDTLCRYLRLLNASLITRIEDAGSTVTIREEMLVHSSTSMRQSMELAVGVMFRILRELVGRPGSRFRSALPTARRANQVHTKHFLVRRWNSIKTSTASCVPAPTCTRRKRPVTPAWPGSPASIWTAPCRSKTRPPAIP